MILVNVNAQFGHPYLTSRWPFSTLTDTAIATSPHSGHGWSGTFGRVVFGRGRMHNAGGGAIQRIYAYC